MKTLTDIITSYTDYVEKLNALFEDESEKKMLKKLRSLTRYIQKTIFCQRSSCQRKSTVLWHSLYKEKHYPSGCSGVVQTFLLPRDSHFL